MLRYALKAFFGGCLGCLGAWFATFSLIAALLVVGLVSGVPQAAVGGLADLGKTISSEIKQIFSAFPPGILPGGGPPGSPFPPEGGPPGFGPPASGTPSATGVTVTLIKQPGGPPETSFSTLDDIEVWVSAPRGSKAKYTARLVDMQGKELVSKTYNASPFGSATGYGNYNADHKLPTGSYKIEVLEDGRLVYTLNFTVGGPSP
ncbi:MAG: hypothetical protein M1136_08110 [Chloroflexi bacterium]|nr:hypothetical protein [Chloroflexota bacterium]MCL5075597.1 hypothetical protein [Chloroflexota bacterium]